jgi:hypothetical protein
MQLTEREVKLGAGMEDPGPTLYIFDFIRR